MLRLSRAEDLILSHHHGDHTGGLETLRKGLAQKNPKALSRIHVAEDTKDAPARTLLIYSNILI